MPLFPPPLRAVLRAVYSELGACRAWHPANMPCKALVLPTPSPQFHFPL